MNNRRLDNPVRNRLKIRTKTINAETIAFDEPTYLGSRSVAEVATFRPSTSSVRTSGVFRKAA